MKNICLIVLLGLSTNLIGQDVTYEITSPPTLHGDSLNHVYRFFSYLTNNTTDSISIKYVRIQNDVTPNHIYNGLCTDIMCYFVKQDTVIEYIPPMTTHKIESRWIVLEDIESGQGYAEWELSFNDTKTVIDTFPTEFIYEKKSTATVDFDFKALSINPNPVENYIRFSEMDLKDVQIYSINGKRVLNTLQVNGQEVDVSQLNVGQYFGRATKGNTTFKFKFFKS